MRDKALLAWSSGKDSAWALHVLRRRDDVEVVGLLTTMDEASRRVAMHTVREELVRAQAEAVRLPLVVVAIPSPCSPRQYESAMGGAVARAQAQGVSVVAFGDLFLEDVRRYREERLAPTGIRALFPLWGLETGELAREMVDGGLRAVVTCVDTRQLAPGFVGRAFDRAFLGDLPAGVDPCGENGEFHSFAFDGPTFGEAVPFAPGAVREGDGFVAADLTPA